MSCVFVVGESAADAARSIAAQLSALEVQAAGQAAECKELLAMKQVCAYVCVCVCVRVCVSPKL
jgi:hypothetical protein